jgi:hypothetical protein
MAILDILDIVGGGAYTGVGIAASVAGIRVPDRKNEKADQAG